MSPLRRFDLPARTKKSFHFLSEKKEEKALFFLDGVGIRLGITEIRSFGSERSDEASNKIRCLPLGLKSDEGRRTLAIPLVGFLGVCGEQKELLLVVRVREKGREKSRGYMKGVE